MNLLKMVAPVFLLVTILQSQVAHSHDEGHGPKLTDTGKQGGVVAPVIDAQEAKKGAHAAVVHKAELVRSEDGTVRVYIYDKAMNPIDTGKLEASANGVLEFKKNKKWTKDSFLLKTEDGAYVGKAPKAGSKPFNIDIRFKDATGRELLTAFDNLD